MNWQPPDEVRFRRRIPWGAIFLLLLGLAVGMAGGFAPDSMPVVAALLALAVGVFAATPAGFTLRFHPDGIEHREAGIRISFHEITYLGLTNRVIFDSSSEKASEMLVGHAGGCWRLGSRADIPRKDLYRFLLEKSRLLAPPPVLPGQLMEVYQREVADFGPDQVLASTGRGTDEIRTQGWWAFWVIFMALVLGLVVGRAMNASDEVSAVFGLVAGTFLIFALVFSILFGAQRRSLLKFRRSCGIVISPRGLTMESPLIKGVITWAEIKDVIVVNHSRPQFRGLMLKIEGGRLLLGDHYICPFTEIHRRITSYLSFERR